MVVFPNAKINIGLNVIRKREDGYHDIETLFYPVGWNDILEIVPSQTEESHLYLSGNKIDCPPEKNIVMKAYRKLCNLVSLPPTDIYLHKIIPDGAGLGGGSSDAAHTLIALNELYELGYSKDELAIMAAELGADCPFFIYNYPMFATDIGTKLNNFNIDLTAYSIIIVKPDCSVSTKEAYDGIIPNKPAYNLCDLLNLPVESWQGKIVNDFESTVTKRHPIIEKIEKKLINLGAIYVSMSGSGSAVYGIFKNDILSVNVKNEFTGCDIYIGKLN